MPRDFLPRREGELISWSGAFSSAISRAPQEVGLTPGQCEQYALLHEAFRSSCVLAEGGGTRTPAVLAQKRMNRAALEAEARLLAGIVRAQPLVSDEQRIALGLSQRRHGRRAPLPPPADQPVISIGPVTGGTVELRLCDGVGTGSGAKPRGASGACVFSFVGDEPPVEADAWKFEFNTSRTRAAVTFGPHVPPGAKVWLTACWYNPRGQRGPAATAAYTHIACAAPLPSTQGLRAAA